MFNEILNIKIKDGVSFGLINKKYIIICLFKEEEVYEKI